MPATSVGQENEDWPDWDDWSATGAPAGTSGEDGAEEDDEADDEGGDLQGGSRCRMDKWLWAARFYRTRSLAKEAIEGGKVHCEGQRVKVSKEVKVGMTLDIRQGFDEKSVVVKALSEVRGAATVAQKLYEETTASVAARDQHQADRRAQNLAHPDHRPNKKERRQIHRFKDHRGD
ncbi:MAG: RNA-binding protein [Moraxellaceae bacterium]|jgi:ribosome-associated heat shock protein Hsp15|nr:RNA-binding protein [Moraxellaceae bacterium]